MKVFPKPALCVGVAMLLGLAGCLGGAGSGMPEHQSLGDGGADMAATPPAGHLASCSSLPPASGFVTRRDRGLWQDGKPFRVGGANLYYLQQLYAQAEMGDAMAESVADAALDGVACMGLGVVRMWAFNDQEKIVSTIRSAPGVYHEAGLRGLDRAVAEAKARGLLVLLTLTNNWKEYGGLPAFARWAGKSHDDFFQDETMLGWWKDYVSLLSRRRNVFTGILYANEPAIFAWELANELRCTSCADATRLTDTVAAMARHARRVLPHHLLADGGEGFDDDPALYNGLSNTYAVAGHEGASFHRLAKIEQLDLLSHHFYPAGWGLDPGLDASIWLRRHDTIARAAGKIAYMGEFGLGSREQPYPDASRAPVYDEWLEQLFVNSGGVLGFFWQFVPAGRGNTDAHAVRHSIDHETVRTFEAWMRRAR